MKTINIEDLNLETVENVELVKTYIPFVEKMNLIKQMLKTSSKMKNGNLILNHTDFYMSMYLMVTSLYLNIKFDKLTSTNYDILRVMNLIDVIMPEQEKDEWKNISEAEINNLNQSYAYKQIVADFLFQLNQTISPVMDAAISMLDRGDPNKIAKYLSPSFEKIANKMPDLKNREETIKFKEAIKNTRNE